MNLSYKHFKRFIGVLLLLICFATKTLCQEFKLIAKIDTVASLAAIDNFDNIFLVTPKNEVLKFNSNGKFLWNYTNNSYGKISQLDVTDPLRVILYYPDYQQLVVLNNTLSEINKFSFNNNPNQMITAVASSNNNGFWVYDSVNRELKKLSNNFTEDLNTGNIYQRDGLNPQSTFMINSNEYLLMNDGDKGIQIFDRFGNFFKTAVVPATKQFDVDGHTIYYTKNGELNSYNFITFESKTQIIPQQIGFTDAILHHNRLIILTEKGVSLWAVK
jgi:hypothetical protein